MSVQRLSRRLQRNYNSAIQTAVQREQAALQRLANEFASADESRRQYLLWQARRQGGIVSNIADELSRSSETALQMIRGESLNQFMQGYRDTVGNLQRQVRDMGMSVDWNMIDRNALNAIFNGEGRELFSQIGFREDFSHFSWVWDSETGKDRLRSNYFLNRAGDRLGDNAKIVMRLQNELAQSLILGETQLDRIRRIRNVTGMAQRQARRIAQTEMAKAQSAGRYLAAEQAEKEYGLPMLKTWHHKSGQENPRLNHGALNGKTIPKNEPFDVDGEPMMYSQDVNASARNIINCHCSTTYRVDTTAMQINRLNNADDSGIMDIGDGGMNVLPRADEAVIPIEKFTKYALDPDGDRNKAIAFERALGYNINNADKLMEQIRDNITNFPASIKGNKGFGNMYEVVMDIKGENGKVAKVLTGWIDDISNGEMRLTTVHIDS